jgi:hypothetical protein
LKNLSPIEGFIIKPPAHGVYARVKKMIRIGGLSEKVFETGIMGFKTDVRFNNENRKNREKHTGSRNTFQQILLVRY